MKQIAKPVQFALVPFSGSVNVGPDNATSATWMDQDGLSPIHHENFDWTTAARRSTISGVYYKKGNGWGAAGR